ncbi:MAG: hypothetical protein R3B07_37040 [Polyangiaceae bacterium]
MLPSTEDCAASDADENCDGFECGVWARAFSGISVGQVVAKSDGALLIAGSFYGDIEFAGKAYHAVPASLFVAELDAEGNGLWLSDLGALGAPRGLVLDPLGGAYVLAEKAKGFPNFGGLLSVILAVDSSGGLRWSKEYNQRAFRAIAADQMGVVMAGSLVEPIDLGDGELQPAGEDAIVTRLSRAGALVWKQMFGGGPEDHVNDVVLDASGYFYCVGLVGGSLGGAQLPLGSNKGFVLRLGADGTFSNQLILAANEKFSVEPLRVATDKAASVTVLGKFPKDFNTVDFDETLGTQPQAFLMRLHTAFPNRFEIDWETSVSPADPEASVVAVGSRGETTVGGQVRYAAAWGGETPGVGSSILTKFDSSGRYAWHQLPSGPTGGISRVVVLDSEEVVAVGATTGAAIDVGTGSIPALDSFIFKTGK